MLEEFGVVSCPQWVFVGWRVEVWGRLDDGIEQNWVVVSKIFYFHPYLGKIPILTNIFQMGWNHQLEYEKKQLAGVYFLECIHPWYYMVIFWSLFFFWIFVHKTVGGESTNSMVMTASDFAVEWNLSFLNGSPADRKKKEHWVVRKQDLRLLLVRISEIYLYHI